MALTIQQIRDVDSFIIIDGNSLMHRAFHAVPPTMNAPDGRPTNAVFGFIQMLIKLIEDFHPKAIVCAFDAGIPDFRMEALGEYKAQRPSMDNMLREQFPMIEELLEAMSIPVIKLEGWEGDDILGTLSTQAEAVGKEVFLITGDKDAYQLATDHVSIVTTKKGISDIVVYDPDAVVDRYGVTPEQVPDFLGLKGDSSDNIPGVPGVGEKTAASLLQKYGNLEGIYEHADSLKGKMGENVRSGRDSAFRSRVVATIRHDLPLDLDPDTVSFPSFDHLKVRAAFGKLRMNTQLNKVLSLDTGPAARDVSGQEADFLGEKGSDAKAIVSPRLEGEEASQVLDEWISQDKELAVVVDDGADEALFAKDAELFVASDSGVAHMEGSEAAAALARLVKRGNIICADAKTLLRHVFPGDSSETASVTYAELKACNLIDVTVVAYLLDSARRDFALEGLVAEFFECDITDRETGRSDGAVRAASLIPLAHLLLGRLEEDGSARCFEDIEKPLTPVLLGMERTGVTIQPSSLEELSVSTAGEINELKREIFRSAGEEFNVDSTKQLGEILFEKLKLPVVKRTKRGYSTDAKVLQELENVHPIAKMVEQYRELAKIKSTYIDVLPTLIGDDGKLHTTFHQTATATGRLSSSDPNLQNIPVRTEFGRQIRKAFEPGEGRVFLSADYSQIELRLLAHLSGDEGLIGAFDQGQDFHRNTASRVFGVPFDEVTPQLRSRAKAINFGIVYGQQAYGLSQSLGCSFNEAREMIERYFQAYPQVRTYLDTVIEYARENGYVETMFGRKRRIPEIHSSNAQIRQFGERTAMNHPMQGSAADIIKLAMVEVDRELGESDLDVCFCLQVHDELDFECAIEDSERLGELVSNVMSGIVELDVPLDVSVATGRTWADAK